MRLDPSEIEALADALAPKVAHIIERRLSEQPQLALSVPEAAAYIRVEQHAIRNAIAAGRLPVCKIGHQVRIRRSDLFTLRGEVTGE